MFEIRHCMWTIGRYEGVRNTNHSLLSGMVYDDISLTLSFSYSMKRR